MNLSLVPFNKSTDYEVKVSFSQKNETFLFDYRISGNYSSIKLPMPKSVPQRIEGLYRHTCFEVFLGLKDNRYMEWNFSPSGDWYLFAFDSYRKPSKLSLVLENPNFTPIKFSRTPEEISFSLELSLEPFIDFFPKKEKRYLGITSVIEKINGEIDYWAIQHLDKKPDFHLMESFILLD